eukprot:scaffold81949_cov46-Phaeocystis_antarctica.AAC.2
MPATRFLAKAVKASKAGGPRCADNGSLVVKHVINKLATLRVSPLTIGRTWKASWKRWRIFSSRILLAGDASGRSPWCGSGGRARPGEPERCPVANVRMLSRYPFTLTRTRTSRSPSLTLIRTMSWPLADHTLIRTMACPSSERLTASLSLAASLRIPDIAAPSLALTCMLLTEVVPSQLSRPSALRDRRRPHPPPRFWIPPPRTRHLDDHAHPPRDDALCSQRLEPPTF